MALERPPLIQARNYTKANRKPEDTRLEVIHCMQAPEKPNTAENVAKWMAGALAPKASAHYLYDNDSEVQGVLDKDVAWAAPGANHDGRHYELSGYAQQTRQEWLDPFGLSMLARVARRVSENCDLSGNPKTWLGNREVELGRRGITHHLVISEVYKKSSHWDVGYHFPVDLFVDMVRAAPLLQSAPAQNGVPTIMHDAQDFLICPVDGGEQKLQADGGVFNANGCNHYHGSYLEPDMAPHRNAPRTFRAIQRVGTTGYRILANDGATYEFSAP